MSRSLNKVILIGNLTRDPELRYTPAGTAVCTFGLATNRRWTQDGQTKEETVFHNIVAWARQAEICAQYLSKGRQAYVEGRIATRDWETKEGEKRRTTEIIATDVIFLSGPSAPTEDTDTAVPEEAPPQDETAAPAKSDSAKTTKPKKSKPKKAAADSETSSPASSAPKDEDDIPF